MPEHGVDMLLTLFSEYINTFSAVGLIHELSLLLFKYSFPIVPRPSFCFIYLHGAVASEGARALYPSSIYILFRIHFVM